MSDFTVIVLKFLVTALIAGALAGAMNAARAHRPADMPDGQTLSEGLEPNSGPATF